MRKALIPAFLLVLSSTVLGATVLREPLAKAAAGAIPSVSVSNSSAHAVPVREQNLDGSGDIRVSAPKGRTIDVVAEPTLVPSGQLGLIVGPFETTDCRSLELFVKPGAGVTDFWTVALHPVVAGHTFGSTFLAAGLRGKTEIGDGQWAWEIDGMPVTAPAVKVQITFGPIGPTEPQPFDGAWLFCGR
jgi:hypothetical protein